MKVLGKYWKEDNEFWLAEIPALDIMTQAETKEEIPLMVKDAIELLADDPELNIDVKISGDSLVVEASDLKRFIPFLLRQMRLRSNLTLEKVALSLNSKSINDYVQYEQGKSLPGIEKFEQFLKVFNPESSDLILNI